VVGFVCKVGLNLPFLMLILFFSFLFFIMDKIEAFEHNIMMGFGEFMGRESVLAYTTHTHTHTHETRVVCVCVTIAKWFLQPRKSSKGFHSMEGLSFRIPFGGEWTVCKIGNGQQVQIGEDPWLGVRNDC
jgi:hypothetical protein